MLRKNLQYTTLLICILCAVSPLSAEVVYTQADSLRVVQLVESAPSDATPMWYARQLLGVPYVGATLEKSLDTEPLVVNLHELDCTTIVETVAALWQTQREGGADVWQTYCRWLEHYRYWAGCREDYCSRHHYFSWWWHDNVEQGLLQEVDLSPSGAQLTPLVIKLNYMSLHPDSYRQLAAHPDLVERLRPQEQQYSGRDGEYLSQEELLRLGSAAFRGVIEEGDIIAIVTSKAGLDYSHLGFASWQSDGRLHLLNASSLHHKVVDEPKTLYQYLAEHPASVGIRVFRLR